MSEAVPLVRPRVRRARTLGELLVVGGMVAVVGGLTASPVIGAYLPQPETQAVLTLVAAAVAAAAALLGAVAGQLLDDPRARWLAAALTGYALVVLPVTAVVLSDPTRADDLTLKAVRLGAYVVTVALLALVVWPPRRVGPVVTATCTVLGLFLAIGVGPLATAVAPDVVQAVVGGPYSTILVLCGWTAVAVAVLAEGHHRDSAPRRQAGTGLVVVAAAQLIRTVSTPGGTSDLVFAGLRLLGLVLVLIGLAQLVVRAFTDLRHDQFHQQEELSTAALHMERARELAAERDHELRNGLAGLAGITHLLSSPPDSDEHVHLRHAVLAELSRLHGLLGDHYDDDDLADDGPADPDGPGYLVGPVLGGLVALRRVSGAAVELVVTPGLRAGGDSEVLAQVVTNLLANCDRHAPGAPVVIEALTDGESALVRVRDRGPGLPPGREEAVLRPGVRDPSAGGSGLGLSISARLVQREGGTLTVETVSDPRGCLATVVLPLAGAPLRDTQPAG